MALQTICDNCENLWLVDNLLYVTALNKNLCPVCLNQLVDLLILQISEKQWHSVKRELEEF